MSTRDRPEHRSRLTGREEMDRLTLRMPKGQLEAIEHLEETDQYASRSAVVRDAIRHFLKEVDAE